MSHNRPTPTRPDRHTQTNRFLAGIIFLAMMLAAATISPVGAQTDQPDQKAGSETVPVEEIPESFKEGFDPYDVPGADRPVPATVDARPGGKVEIIKAPPFIGRNPDDDQLPPKTDTPPIKTLPQVDLEISSDTKNPVFEDTPFGIRIPKADRAGKPGSKKPATINLETLPAKQTRALSNAGAAFTLTIDGFTARPTKLPRLDIDKPAGRKGENVVPTDRVDLGQASGWELTIDRALLPAELNNEQRDRLSVFIHTECDLTLECKVVEQLPTHIDDQGLLVAELGSEVLQAVGGPDRTKPVPVGAPGIGGLGFRPALIPNVHGFAFQSNSGVFFSVSTATSGSQNDYAANSLASLATWQVGIQTGHAETSYTVPLPAAVGPNPDITFSYSSGTVDGMTSSKNNQGGTVGVGWSTSQPVISRDTRGCASSSDTQPGGTGIDANGWWEHNLCFAHEGDEKNGFTLSMNGVGGRLVRSGAANLTHPTVTGATYQRFVTENTNDMRIWLVTQPTILTNGTNNGGTYGQWWEVTTSDGTLYVFGRDFIFKPTTATAAPLAAHRVVDTTHRTNSTQAVPVAKPGSSCGLELCDTVIAWHLDQVIDPNGNMATYQYWRDTNYYRKTAHQGTASYHPYHRSVNPTFIDYGLTYNTSSVLPASTGNGSRYRIAFGYSYRSPHGGLNEPAAGWADTPTDLLCGSNGVSWDGTSCITNTTPSFFNIIKLSGLTTYANGQRVSAEVLSHEFPFPPSNDGSVQKLWLKNIQHQGSTTASATPAIAFRADWMANRVNHPGQIPSMTMPRIDRISTELGGEITFTYGQPHGWEPSSTVPSTDPCYTGTNDPNGYIRTGCYFFMQHYTLGSSSAAIAFNKWVVTKTREDAGLNGHSDYTESTFTYDTSPDWAFSEQPGFTATDINTGITNANYRHCEYGYGCNYWADYRGHREVSVTDRDGNLSKHFFYTGMADDRTNPANIGPLRTTSPSDPAVNITTPNGGSSLNSKTWRGRSAGTQTFAPDNISPDYLEQTGFTETAFTGAWIVNPTTPTLWPGSFNTQTSHQTTQIRDHLNTGYAQTTELWSFFDEIGRLYRVQDLGLTASTTVSPLPNDDVTTCMAYTRASPAAHAGSWIIGSPWKTASVAYKNTTCTVTGTVFPAAGTSWISGETLRFDGSTSAGALATRGNLTDSYIFPRRGLSHTSWPGATNTYWPNGQIKTSIERHTNALTETFYNDFGHITSIDGPLLGSGDLTSFTTDWRGLQETITTKNAQANGGSLVTSLTYDGLGRLKTVKLPGAPKSSYIFDYSISNEHNTTSYTKTRVLRQSGAGSGEYITSYSVLDGFGREVQAQTVNPVTSSLNITSVFYGDVGQVKKSTNPVDSDETSYGSLVSPSTWTNGWTTTTITPDTRKISTVHRNSAGVSQASSWTQTHGLITLSRDPINLQTTTATSDIRGNTVKVTDNTGTTRFGFNVRNQVTSIDGPGTGDTITYSYGTNWHTQLQQLIDPDLGTVSYTHHYSGQLKTQTDGNGTKIAVSYNIAGQPTALRQNTTSGPLISTFGYDNTGRITGTAHYNRLPGGTSNGTVTQTFSYDARGRADTTGWVIPGLSGTQTITQTLREMGTTASINYPGTNDTAVFTYDALERQNTLVFDGDTLGSVPVFNARGQIESFNAGNPTQTGQAYASHVLDYDDWSGRLKLKTADSGSINLTDYAYTWDDNGNLKTVNDTSGGIAQYQCYKYDNADRLVQGYTTDGTCTTPSFHNTGPDPFQVDYTYHPNGNIKTATGTGTLNSTYSYGAGSAGPHAVTSAGGNTYGYDNGGNQTSRTIDGQTSTLTYDTQNRLVAIDGAGADMDALYDASGNRVKRTLDGEDTFYVGASYEIQPTGTPPGSGGSGGGGGTTTTTAPTTTTTAPTTTTTTGSSTTTAGGGGTKTVTVQATSYWDSPVFGLEVNGVPTDGTRTVTSSGMPYSTYTFQVPTAAQIDDLKITFDNVPAAALAIGWVEIDGHQYEASSTDVAKMGDYNSGCTTVLYTSLNIINCPGYFDFVGVTPVGGGTTTTAPTTTTTTGSSTTTTGGGGTKTVTVQATSYWDSPVFGLEVDGVATDGTRTVTSSGMPYSTYTFQVPSAAEIDDLKITFENVPAAALAIGWIEIDGHQYEASSTDVAKMGDYNSGCTTVLYTSLNIINCAGYFDFAGVTPVGGTTTTTTTAPTTTTTTTGSTTTTTTGGGSGSGSGVIRVHHSFNSQNLGSTINGDFVLTVTDHLGSSGVNRQADGTTVVQKYTPFGIARNSGGGNGLWSDLTFTGQTDDPGTGLIDYNARAYDPQVGRFIMADTVLDGLNRYTYVRNNPGRFTDPTGHCVYGLPCPVDEVKATAVIVGESVEAAGSIASEATSDAVSEVVSLASGSLPDELARRPLEPFVDAFDHAVDSFNNRPVDVGIDGSVCPLVGCISAHIGTDGAYVEPTVGLAYALGAWGTMKPRSDTELETGWQPANRNQIFGWLSFAGADYTFEDDLTEGEWGWTTYKGPDLPQVPIPKTKITLGWGGGFAHSWGRYEVSWNTVWSAFL